MYWKTFYNQRVLELGSGEHLRQVGHTENGLPISDAHAKALSDQIITALALSPEDDVLDLCCGNGFFTRRLANQVRSVLGADISEELIQVARQDHGAANITYGVHDACEVASLSAPEGRGFSKIVLFAALQHFTVEAFSGMLEGMVHVGTPDVRIFIGFIPDVEKQDLFYGTEERRQMHERHIAAGTDSFGKWWSQDALRVAAVQHGLTCRFTDLPEGLLAASYRFNAVLDRPAS